MFRHAILALGFASGALAAALFPTSYDYPEQPGLENITKTDADRFLLINGRVGVDGPSAVWGKWGVRELVVDWSFKKPAFIEAIEVVIVHPRESSDAAHPHRLHLYPAASGASSFAATPAFTLDIPFEVGRLQTVKLPLPRGLAAAKLRTVFESTQKQVVLAEVRFDGRPATAQEIAHARSAATQTQAAPAPSATPAPSPQTTPAVSSATPRYDFPPQHGREHIVETDPERTRLTDGKTGVTGDRSVWGKWGSKEMLVDWTFEKPTRVKAMRVVITHPRAESDNSHASAIRVHALSGGTAEFLPEPDFEKPIPFEAGSLQEVRLVFPDGGIIAERLRTVFIAARHQVVLSEVSFETEPASAASAADAQRKREQAQPERFAPVTWLPHPLAPDARVTGDSMFGVCGHFLHTNEFYSGNDARFNNHWRPSRTLPWLVEGNFGWVREALYRSTFTPTGPDGGKGAANRRKVETYLQRYQDRGVKVLLCPMFGGTPGEDFESYATWIGELARRFPVVRAVELHNEPNLKGFWKGTPQEFVDTARRFTSIVKSVAPEVVIVAGSFAGWGGAWQHEDLRELLPGPREIATRYAEEVFKLGLLEFADAVSAHPYRGQSAPEGGEVLESPTDPEGFVKEIRGWLDLAAKYTPGGKRLPIYLTEIGYSVSHQGYTTVANEARQADYLSRLQLTLLDARLRGLPLEAVFWYDLKQDEIESSHYESNFGIVAPNASRPRPAWLSARRINEFFSDPSTLKVADDIAKPSFFNGDDLIQRHVWRHLADDALIVPFWRLNQLMKKDADFESVLELSLPAGTRVTEVILHDLHEDRPRRVGFAVENNRLRVPVHVTSRAAWLVVR